MFTTIKCDVHIVIKYFLSKYFNRKKWMFLNVFVRNTLNAFSCRECVQIIEVDSKGYCTCGIKTQKSKTPVIAILYGI